MKVKAIYRVYALYDPRAFGDVRYVGCTGNRLETRLQSHIAVAIKGDQWQPVVEWVRGLLIENVEPGIRLLELTDKENWPEREAYWITHYLGSGLTNMAAGGLGSPGVKLSERRRAKLKETRKGIPNTPEHNAKIAAANTGHKHSDETRAKISENRKGKHLGPLSQEHRKTIADATKGRVFSDEHRAKLAAHNAARWEDPAYRERMSAIRRTRVISDETRAKMSATRKRLALEKKVGVSTN